MNIRVDLNTPIHDGREVVFRSPVDCSQITGLILYYPENGITVSKEFAFTDAHGNDVGDIDHLFAENVVVKVILELATNKAFVQNADTNAYLEGRFAELEDLIGSGGGGSGGDVAEYRHIATFTNDTGEDVMQIDVTKDSDGNGFSCSEFFIYAKIPPATGNQLYIGSAIYKWLFFSSVAKSSTATRTLAIELKHTGDGWWRGSMLALDNAADFTSTNGSNLYTNFRSNVNVGEKLSSLCFYGGSAPFPNGTTFEIYGK